MPLHNLGGGCYRWGQTGKRYCGAGAKAKAMRQARAIEWRKYSAGNALGSQFVEANIKDVNLESIIFPHDKFSEARAQDWLDQNGFKGELTKEDEFYLFSVSDLGEAVELYELSNGVQIICGE